jgi:FolB domain-containing protein
MSDVISIHDLKVWTHIGVPEEERKNEQCLRISIELFTDTRNAGEKDSIDETIDYEAIVRSVQKLATKERRTIEALAEDIASELVKEFKPQSVKIFVRKDILPETDGISVTIQRP